MKMTTGAEANSANIQPAYVQQKSMTMEYANEGLQQKEPALDMSPLRLGPI